MSGIASNAAPITKRHVGNPGWKPGVSGNPGGRLKTEVDIAALARVHGPKCIEVAAKLLSSEDEKMRLAACIALLDRGFGRPKQEYDVNGTSTIELHLVAAKMVSQQLLDGTIEAEITEPDIEVSSISPEAEAEQPTE